jgi:predicted acylesterase/phospholipase RssA
MSQTKFFQNCLGVFSGGGCKAIAFAGAYEEAVSGGIHLNQVAGTSAGSIVAALIGAGASPEFLTEAMNNLDFTQLLDKPETIQKNSRSKYHRRALLLYFFCFKKIARIIRKGGVYSSRKIDIWVKDKLKQLSGKDETLFRDLPIPTYIIGTNIMTSKIKVWSKENTPDESVSHAVRCSCSIPFFFQSVSIGESRFVDGGVLSNLPYFVFSKSSSPQEIMAEKILAFRLISDTEKTVDWSIESIFKKLINSLIDGASALQANMMILKK